MNDIEIFDHISIIKNKTNNSQQKEKSFRVISQYVLDLVIWISKNYGVKGYSREDIKSECYLVLWNEIIPTFDLEKNVPFRIFSSILMKRRMFSLIQASRRQKRYSLNSVSLYSKCYNKHNELYGDYLNSDWRNPSNEELINQIENVKCVQPEKIVEQKESYEKCLNKLSSILSKTEAETLLTVTDDTSYKEIGEKYNLSIKTVDNARQRIAEKGKVLLACPRISKIKIKKTRKHKGQNL